MQHTHYTQQLCSALPLLALAGMLSACGGSGTNPVQPSNNIIAFDCTDGPSCPVINVVGDPVYRLPDGNESPISGHADPSIRKDPVTNRLWMSYSHVGLHIDPSADPLVPFVTPYVSIHLAHSDDQGAHWSYDKSIWDSTAGIDQGFTTQIGYSIHEVSTIAPFTNNTGTQWFGLHLRYFLPLAQPIEKRLSDSIQYRLSQVASPTQLGSASEAIISGPLLASGWGTSTNLSTLAPELNQCSVWSESALHQYNNKLYLIAECLVFDFTQNPPVNVVEHGFNGVFVSDVSNNVSQLNWRWVGKLTDYHDAVTLGGKILTQVDVARARDGKMILLVTPTDSTDGGPFAHLGCRVLQIDDLATAKLSRRDDGSPIIRADIRSSDSESSGLCSYDSASSTGIILVRTRVQSAPPKVSWQLHATGVHP